MRQQSFVGRVWLDITEREKSHPIIYMTKIGKVSDVNAMRLTTPCPSAVVIFIWVATLAEYILHCFSTGDSAHQADLGGGGGGFCNGAEPQSTKQWRDFPRDVVARTTAGNQLAGEQPVLACRRGAGTADESGWAGGSSEPKRKRDLNRGGNTVLSFFPTTSVLLLFNLTLRNLYF